MIPRNRVLGATVLGVLVLLLVAGIGQATHGPSNGSNNTTGAMRSTHLDHIAAFDFKNENWNFSNSSVGPTPDVNQEVSSWINFCTNCFAENQSSPDIVQNGPSTPNQSVNNQGDQSFDWGTNFSQASVVDQGNVTLAVATQVFSEAATGDSTSTARQRYIQGAGANIRLMAEDANDEFLCRFDTAAGNTFERSTSFLQGVSMENHTYAWATFRNLGTGNGARIKCGIGADEGAGGDRKVYVNETIGDGMLAEAGQGLYNERNIDIDGAHFFQLNQALRDPSAIFDLLAEPFEVVELVADFTFSCDGRTCDFTDQSQAGSDPIDTWNWSFGDGSTSTQQNPTHTYSTFGTFTVNLTVTDTSGTSDSVEKTVTTFIPPEFNRSSGLNTSSTLVDIGTSWDNNDPNVYGKDNADDPNPEDGRLLKWNETGIVERQRGLCTGSDISEREDSNTDFGFAVTKDTGGFPVTDCVSRAVDPNRRAFVIYTNNLDQTQIVRGGDSLDAQTDIQGRSANNLTWTNGPSLRGLWNAGTFSYEWVVENPDDRATRAAIQWNSSRDPVACYTDAVGGTECRRDDGFLIGRDDNMDRADIAFFDDTIHLLDGSTTLERRTTGLNLKNSTSVTSAQAPVEIAKTGDFIAHRNNSDGERVDIRRADNHSLVATTEANLGGAIEDIAFHPRNERLYAVNNTRLIVYNLTNIVATETTQTEDTTVPDTGEEDDDPTTDEDNPLGVDTGETADALNLSESSAEVFLGLLFVVAMGGGVGLTFVKAGGPALPGAAIGAFGGVVLATVIGWWPLWGTFLIVVALIALVVGRMGIFGPG